MKSLSDDKQADIIDALNTTSRYLDDILNINNIYIDNMVGQIYPSKPLLLKPRFWICPFLMIFILPKITIKVTILILKLYMSHLYMVIFLVLHPLEFIFLS